VTAFPLRDLAPLYADSLARPIRQADLVRIAQAITDKYRAAGYFLTRAAVPPQGASPGHARLRVYEGYIEKVEITGDAARSVKTLLIPLAGRRPLKLADFERRLMLATDLPGVRTHYALEPDLEDPARHRLVVQANLQRWTASLYADNRGAKAFGTDQAYLRAGMNSALLPGDQLAVATLTAPGKLGSVSEGEVSYMAPFADGARFGFAAQAARFEQGVTPLTRIAGSKSRSISLRLSAPLERSRLSSVWASAGFDARRVEQVYLNDAAYHDELRVLRAALQGTRLGPGRSSSFFVQASRGLGVLGASRARDVGRSRFAADAQFWKVNAEVTHYRDLGPYAGIYVSADAQWAPEPLLLSEAFAPGGLPYGRAYSYGEISGDSGVAGLVELRVGADPKQKPLTFVQAYGFADAAKVWRRAPSYGPTSADLASAGAGVRLIFGKRATLRLEAAKPLGPVPWEARNRNWRTYVSLSAGF
jgi:hemolysin activation/secretion protein